MIHLLIGTIVFNDYQLYKIKVETLLDVLRTILLLLVYCKAVGPVSCAINVTEPALIVKRRGVTMVFLAWLADDCTAAPCKDF